MRSPDRSNSSVFDCTNHAEPPSPLLCRTGLSDRSLLVHIVSPITVQGFAENTPSVPRFFLSPPPRGAQSGALPDTGVIAAARIPSVEIFHPLRNCCVIVAARAIWKRALSDPLPSPHPKPPCFSSSPSLSLLPHGPPPSTQYHHNQNQSQKYHPPSIILSDSEEYYPHVTNMGITICKSAGGIGRSLSQTGMGTEDIYLRRICDLSDIRDPGW